MKVFDAFPRWVLPRYGQTVTLTRRDGGQETGRAMLQPILEKAGGKAQEIFTPLGVKSNNRYLYLGPPDLALDQAAYLTCEGRDFAIRQAQPVRVGESCTHWWGILAGREEGACDLADAGDSREHDRVLEK